MQDIRCSILPIFPAHSVSSLGTQSCFPRILFLFAQETKNTHHSLVTSNGLRLGWESRWTEDIVWRILLFPAFFFFFGLACILSFLYCNLNFVLFFFIHSWICLLLVSKSCCLMFEEKVSSFARVGSGLSSALSIFLSRSCTWWICEPVRSWYWAGSTPLHQP